MINKIFPHGTGSGKKVVGYVLDENRHEIKPEIMRGDPELTIKFIDEITNKRKYTSGVLSFEKNIDDKTLNSIMNEFEKTAFGDLSTYNVLWVKHSDHDRTELHYVSPRVDLETGKSFNLWPPGQMHMKRWDSYRDYINKKYGLADPTDHNRKKDVKIPDHLQKKSTLADIRTDITNSILLEIRNKTINNFSELKKHIETSFHCKIQRETKTGISITNPSGEGLNIRLKGEIFTSENFSTAAALNNLSSTKENIGILREKMENNQAKWNDFIIDRYLKKPIKITELENEHRTFKNVRKFERELSNIDTESKKRIRIAESENKITRRKNYENRNANVGISSEHDTQIEQIRINFNERQKRRQKRNNRRAIAKYFVEIWSKINRIGSKIDSINRVIIQNYKIRQKIKSYTKTTVKRQNQNKSKGMKM